MWLPLGYLGLSTGSHGIRTSRANKAVDRNCQLAQSRSRNGRSELTLSFGIAPPGGPSPLTLGRKHQTREPMKKQIIIKWAIHLIGAICTAGTVALLVTFCSEVLFRDRGSLDQSLMTWEDFYGAVITTLLAIGLLLVPLRGFSFSRFGFGWEQP